MKDFLLDEALARRRALCNVDGDYVDNSTGWRHNDRLEKLPLYLSSTPVISFGPIINDSLNRRERDNLLAWKNVENKRVCNTSFLRSISLNGILVRVQHSETHIKTCDSIICARFELDSDESDGMNDDDLDERFWFGTVQHLLCYGSGNPQEVAVCVKWCTHENPNADARAGLVPVEIHDMPVREQGQCWVRPDQLVVQQHYKIPSVNGHPEYICIKI
jgi:hypothetical protein